MKRPRYGTPDAENPEWTRKDFAKARPAREILPPAVFARLTGRAPERRKTAGTESPTQVDARSGLRPTPDAD